MTEDAWISEVPFEGAFSQRHAARQMLRAKIAAAYRAGRIKPQGDARRVARARTRIRRCRMGQGI